jgi:hypothetical protein
LGAAALLIAAAVHSATPTTSHAQAGRNEIIAARTRMLALDPKNPDACVTRGVARFLRGDCGHTVDDANEAIWLDHPAGTCRGAFEKAIAEQAACF